MELRRDPPPPLVVVGLLGLHLFVQHLHVVQVIDVDALPQEQRFELLVLARGDAPADIGAEPVVAERHARADQRRGESQRHVSAAENRVVDLLARGVEHRGVRVAVLGRTVGLHGLHTCIEDLVEAGDELSAHEVVGVEDRHGVGGVGSQLLDGGGQGFGLRTVFEGDLDHRQGQFAQLHERRGLQPVGDHRHAVQFRGVRLCQRRLRRTDDDRIGLVGGDQRHETPLFPGRGIGFPPSLHREGREDEEVERREQQRDDEDPVYDVHDHSFPVLCRRKSRAPRRAAAAKSPRPCRSAVRTLLGSAAPNW